MARIIEVYKDFIYSLLFCAIVECSNTVEFNLLEELVCCAHTLSCKTVSRNLVLLNEDVLNCFSTLLRKFLVQLL